MISNCHFQILNMRHTYHDIKITYLEYIYHQSIDILLDKLNIYFDPQMNIISMIHYIKGFHSQHIYYLKLNHIHIHMLDIDLLSNQNINDKTYDKYRLN